jgi:hypothetical protein
MNQASPMTMKYKHQPVVYVHLMQPEQPNHKHLVLPGSHCNCRNQFHSHWTSAGLLQNHQVPWDQQVLTQLDQVLIHENTYHLQQMLSTG